MAVKAVGLLLTLTLLFWNARGINNKEVLLKDMMNTEGVSYEGISESKTYRNRRHTRQTVALGPGQGSPTVYYLDDGA